jgi:hypothetical protein
MKALIFQGLGKKALLQSRRSAYGPLLCPRTFFTMPKNRNEAAKQLRAGLEPYFKLRLIIPIETPGVIDDFAQPPAHVAALVDGVTRLCPFSCSYCCGCWCTPQEKSLTLVHW